MTFSNIIALGDYSGSSLTATVTVSSAVLTGSYPFTLTTPCGQTAGALAVVVNNADFVSQSVSAGLNPGLSYAVSITLKNTGTSTWTAADNFQLGAQNPANNTTWGLSRVPLAPGETVAPGAIKTFSFNVTAPTTPGTYNFQWQMLQNGQWFGSPSPNLAVIVVPPPTIVSLTPPSGAQGQHDIAVVITGSNLTGAQLSAPSASGIHISNVQVVNSTQVTAIIDIATAAPVQTNSISLATLGGSTSGNFSVTSANTLGSPVVNSISPTILLVDTTHFSETFVLSGSNLANATVDVDPTFTITSLNHFADTQLHVTITANVGTPVGTYFFTIRTPNFGNTTARFRVVASVSKPAIESFTPMNPAAGAQYFLQITGNNLSGTTIASDHAGVLIILGSTGVLNQSSTNPPLLPQGNPPDFQSMGGLLVIDPSVPVGTAVRITLTNALGESDSVVIHVAPASQALIDANNSKGANPPYTFNTVPLGTVSSMTTDLLVQPPQMMEAVTFETQLKKGNRQNLFFDILSCDATCRLRFPLASVLYGIPFIDCGGKLFDQSCFQRLKKGDFRSIHVGFIGIEAILFADITLMSDGSFCFLIPCHLSFGWALNIVLPNSKTLSYSKTYPLPSFLARTSPLPDCTGLRDCTDPVQVYSLPSDFHFCAHLTDVDFSFFAGVLHFASTQESCGDGTAGLDATLSLNPPIISPGGNSFLYWAATARVTSLTVTQQGQAVPLVSCGNSTCMNGVVVVTANQTTTFTLTANGQDGSTIVRNATLIVNTSGAGVTSAPYNLYIATGGVALNANEIQATLTGHPPSGNTMNFQSQFLANPGGNVQAALNITVNNLIGNVFAIPNSNPSNQSPSGMFAVSVCSQLICDPKLVAVTVPPQSLIQLIYGEALQQGRNAKKAMASVVRNRLFNSGFAHNTSYNGLIFDDNQFDALNHSLFWNADYRGNAGLDVSDYDIDLGIAGGIFDGTIFDPTGGSVFFISPTDVQMTGVNDALASGTTTFPSSLSTVAQNLFRNPAPSNWQIVVLSSVEGNTVADPHMHGQPAFIFFRSRNSTDPAVVQW